MNFKTHCTAFLPTALIQVYRNIKRKFSSFQNRSPKEVFTHIYHTNRWGSAESVSGAGSELRHTERLIKSLNELFQQLGIRSILDLPCGDFNWMQQVTLEGINYLGADIVEPLIAQNQATFRHLPQVRFEVLDLLTDPLPQVDLVVVRDCLVHFSFPNIQMALKNIKHSGSTYLLATTFTQLSRNKDIITGEWRPVNLQLEPFLLPPPMLLIAEQLDTTDKILQSKALGLWRVEDL
ncbi:MAG: class I SAM-dependent methyltransferase [Saprospiraceae bacterium]|nr:class I SAM-dependent methyltransferase [Saprospiraceae bacterium]